jgi:AAA15 family ATPase/GTPase
MLIEFSVGNFLSFKNINTISLLSSNDSYLINENTFMSKNGLRLLKCIGFYGANASGKSNILKALMFFKNFIVNSSKESRANEEINVINFKLNTFSEKSPSFFEIVFLVEDTIYRYGFEINRKEILGEWLFARFPSDEDKLPKENKLFVRENNKIIIGKNFKEGKKLEEKTRNNSLFLSVVAQFNGEISKKIIKWFLQYNVIFSDSNFFGLTADILGNNRDTKRGDRLKELIKSADLGIEDIVTTEFEENYDDFIKHFPLILEEKGFLIDKNKPIFRTEINTKHKKFDENNKLIGLETFDLAKEESDGTKRFFSIGGPLIDTLDTGKILFIDEIEASLHPLLVQEIIKLFNSKTTNPKNAQLIFTTHNTSFLNLKILRRDQIFFTEKSEYGESKIYSLIEFKNIRKDNSIGKNYLFGKFGAVPYVKNLSNQFISENEQKLF